MGGLVLLIVVVAGVLAVAVVSEIRISKSRPPLLPWRPRIPFPVIIMMAVPMLVVLVVILVVTLVEGASPGHESTSPEEWLDETFHALDGDVGDDGHRFEALVWDPDQVVRKLEAGTEVTETRKVGPTYFLRYESDWLVAVEPTSRGAEVTLFEFDAAYDHYGSAISFWQDHLDD